MAGTDDSGASTAPDDTGTCAEPTREAFTDEALTTLCEWLISDCPASMFTGGELSECLEFYHISWDSLSSYDACAAQTCLDVIREGMPTCESNGGEWQEIDACGFDAVFP